MTSVYVNKSSTACEDQMNLSDALFRQIQAIGSGLERAPVGGNEKGGEKRRPLRPAYV